MRIPLKIVFIVGIVISVNSCRGKIKMHPGRYTLKTSEKLDFIKTMAEVYPEVVDFDSVPSHKSSPASAVFDLVLISRDSLSDMWGNEFRCIADTNKLTVWSLGPNCKDDSGNGDDIKITIEMNPRGNQMNPQFQESRTGKTEQGHN